MDTVIDASRIKDLVRARLLGAEPSRLERLSPPERRVEVRSAVMEVLREQRAILPAGSLADVMNEVSDEVVGLGPIERLLKDPEVSERNLTIWGRREDTSGYIEQGGNGMVHMRAIGYVRLSRADQTSTSPARQRAEIERYCEHHGLELAATYEDIDVSGTSDARKGLEAALGALRDGNRLVVWKLDRLYRSMIGFGVVVKRLSDIGAFLATTDGQVDMASPMGNAMVWMTMIFAELEVKIMAERSRNMHAHLKEQGRWATSRVPFGWSKVDGRLALDPEQQQQLVKMAEGFARGDSLREIGRRFDQGHTGVRHILRSDRTLGALPPELAEGVRSELARRSGGHRRGSSSLLAGIARCGVCGGAMKISTRNNGSGNPNWRAYGCRDKGCTYVDAAWLDAHVGDAVVNMIDTTKIAEHLRPRVPRSVTSAIEARLEALEVARFEQGVISHESFLKRREVLLGKLNAAQVHPATASLPPSDAASLPERWPDLSTDARRRIVDIVLRSVEVGKGTRGKFDPGRVGLVWRVQINTDDGS